MRVMDVETTEAAVDLPTFAESVDAHKSMVFSIGFHYLRDRSLAEEISQEVFLQLHCRWKEMQSRQHIVFWLRKSTSNRCVDELRKRKNNRVFSLTDAAEPSTFERLQDPLLSAYLQRMVASLPERQRLMIILRYQEDLEPDEISKLMGMKPSTVRTLLHRAIDLLRVKTGQRLEQEKRANTDELTR